MTEERQMSEAGPSPMNATYTVHRVDADVVPQESEASYSIPDDIEVASLQDVTTHPEEHQGSFTVSYEVIHRGSK